MMDAEVATRRLTAQCKVLPTTRISRTSVDAGAVVCTQSIRSHWENSRGRPCKRKMAKKVRGARDKRIDAHLPHSHP